MMRIGELCLVAGVSKELIRHYESLGLISSSEIQAGSRSYRDFDEQTLERLSLIKKGKTIGLSLKQIQPLLDAFLNEEMSDTEAIDILKQQALHMDNLIKQAQEVKTTIAHHIDKIEGKRDRTCNSINLLKSN
ncbi:MerR family transcriptional regulator [Vibrio sp. HN007]|uniref:MerR family transcriptional regulator n=1 Tax=Vibrio iocasae TaxID=3098914 RepID=UPI0035D50FAA